MKEKTRNVLLIDPARNGSRGWEFRLCKLCLSDDIEEKIEMDSNTSYFEVNTEDLKQLKSILEKAVK